MKQVQGDKKIITLSFFFSFENKCSQQQTKNLIPYESKTGGYFIAIKKLRNKL